MHDNNIAAPDRAEYFKVVRKDVLRSAWLRRIVIQIDLSSLCYEVDTRISGTSEALKDSLDGEVNEYVSDWLFGRDSENPRLESKSLAAMMDPNSCLLAPEESVREGARVRLAGQSVISDRQWEFVKTLALADRMQAYQTSRAFYRRQEERRIADRDSRPGSPKAP